MKTLLVLIRTSYYTIYIVMMPLIGLGLVTLNTNLIHNYRSVIVSDHAMEPLALQGSLAIVKSVTSYAKNDVITYAVDGKLLTKRIIDTIDTLNGTGYIVLGDNDSASTAQTVTADQIIGKGLIQIMYAGTIFGYLATISGMIYGLVIPSVLFIMLMLYSIHKALLRKFEKKMTAHLKANGLWQTPQSGPSLHQLIRENSYLS